MGWSKASERKDERVAQDHTDADGPVRVGQVDGVAHVGLPVLIFEEKFLRWLGPFAVLVVC